MPTQIFMLSTAPTNLVGATDIDGLALSLENGKTYSARYTATDVQGVMKYLVVPTGTQVTPAARATMIRSFEDVIIKPVATEDLVFWSESNGFLAINGPV